MERRLLKRNIFKRTVGLRPIAVIRSSPNCGRYLDGSAKKVWWENSIFLTKPYFKRRRGGKTQRVCLRHSDAFTADLSIEKPGERAFAPSSFLVMIPLLNWSNSSERRCFVRRRGRRNCPTSQTPMTKNRRQTNFPADGGNTAVVTHLKSAIEKSMSGIATGSCRSPFYRTSDDGKRGPPMSAIATGTLSRGGIRTRPNDSPYWPSPAPRR